MGLQTVPAYIGAIGYQHPVELDRNLLEAIFGRSGVNRFGDFTVTPTGTAHQISIASGSAFLLGAENAQQGGYFAWSDAAQTMLMAVPSAQPRIDSLILRVKDGQYGSITGTASAYFDLVTGVAAGSPSVRADSDFNPAGSQYVPGAWWRVANILRGVSDTTVPGGNITMLPRYTRRSRAMLLALSTDTISDAVAGDERYDTDTGVTRTYNGSAWVDPGGAYVGMGHVTVGATAVSVSAAEAAIGTTSWAVEPSATFKKNHIYRVEAHYGLGINANTSTAITVRVRKGAQTTAGQVLCSFADTERDSTFYSPHFHIGWIKNVTAADITSILSLTVQRVSAANNATLYGDGTLALQITVKDEGYESGHKMSGVATAIV